MEIYALLPQILNMSFTAGVTILVVLLARLLLKRAPKIFSYLLWGIVLFRLLCPVTFSSSVSLLRIFDRQATETGRIEYISPDIAYESWQEMTLPETGTGTWQQEEEAELPQRAGETTISPVKMQAVIAAYVWFLGVTVMLVYGMTSLFALRRKLVGAVCIRENIYEADYVTSPFVLGTIRPKIYLPVALGDREREFILLHEKTHIKRGDHVGKLLFFLALSIHWFNPLVWLAFRLMEKDMEMSCDEAVMRHMNGDIRAEYSEALIAFATGKNIIAGTPLAFGEGDIKARIKNIMRYHKPAVFVVVLAVAAVIVLAVVLGSNPKNGIGTDGNGTTILLTNPGSLMQDTETEQEMETGQETEQEVQETARREDGTKYPVQYQLAEKWAKAFCDRDGNTITAMSSGTVQDVLQERELLIPSGKEVSFGVSSPWPWNAEADYMVLNVTETSAEILYYAWTSDPHVTVWREKITLTEGMIDAEELEYLDYICAGEEFAWAYPNGITGTRMDYLINGAGETLNQNARNYRENSFYGKLFEPETAAVYLLNLLDNPNKVEVLTESAGEDGSVQVTIHFLEDNSFVALSMIQPYGEDGIWIPHTETDSQEMTAGNGAVNGNYEIPVRSVSREDRCIDGYVVIEEYGLEDPIPFADDCIFRVNQSMSGREYEEVTFDAFADYIEAGEPEMNKLCLMTVVDGEIAEINLESAYYRYGIGYDFPVNDWDEYKMQQEVAGEDLLEQFYELDYSTKADVADTPGEELIEVYTGNIGDGGSGYVFVKDGEGTILYNEFAHFARAGWKNIYLGKNENGNFLLTVHIEDRDDFGVYDYYVFGLGEEGEPEYMAGSVFEFGSAYIYDTELFREWVTELEGYLADSTLLLSTQGGEVRTEHVSDVDRYNFKTLEVLAGGN